MTRFEQVVLYFMAAHTSFSIAEVAENEWMTLGYMILGVGFAFAYLAYCVKGAMGK